MAAQFHNAPFLADLLKVLNHPVTAQTPDLKHFRVVSARGALVAGKAARPQASAAAAASNPVLVAVIVVACWIVVVAAAVGLGRAGKLPRHARRAGLLLLPAVAAILSAGVHAPLAATPAAAGAALLVELPLQAPLQRQEPVLAAPAWQELVAVEHDVASNQDKLEQQEEIIRRIALSPEATPVPTVSEAPGGNQDRTILLDPDARQRRRLQRLLDAYNQATAHYHDSLRREYEVYRGAAKNPALKQQLVAAAASAPVPEVKDVVAYNLAVVQTDLDQEAQITAAEGKLAAIGSLSGAQLSAIRQHQAFIIPVQAPIIQGFGPTDVGFEPSVTYHGTFYPHFHTGLDIIGPENSPVHAAADGVVLLVTSSKDSQGHLIGYGNYVVIAHPNGFVTLYGHLNSLSVKEGQLVHQGEIVGQEGSTGLSTGPHVHFEIRHNSDWVDPAPYLKGQAGT